MSNWGRDPRRDPRQDPRLYRGSQSPNQLDPRQDQRLYRGSQSPNQPEPAGESHMPTTKQEWEMLERAGQTKAKAGLSEHEKALQDAAALRKIALKDPKFLLPGGVESSSSERGHYDIGGSHGSLAAMQAPEIRGLRTTKPAGQPHKGSTALHHSPQTAASQENLRQQYSQQYGQYPAMPPQQHLAPASSQHYPQSAYGQQQSQYAAQSPTTQLHSGQQYHQGGLSATSPVSPRQDRRSAGKRPSRGESASSKDAWPPHSGWPGYHG